MSPLQDAESVRCFLVKACDEGAHCREILASGFEDAALRWVEQWPADAAELSLIVEDRQSGERHCFTVDIGEAVASPCA